MSKSIHLTVYSFSELSPAGKETAKSNHKATCGYAWENEKLESIKALAEYFGARMIDWSVHFDNISQSFAKFYYNEAAQDYILERLNRLGDFNPETLKGKGDNVLTGYCGDENAIDGFRIAWYKNGERDLGKLLQIGFKSWLEAAQEDYQDQYSDEQFGEFCEANEYFFLENGEMYKGNIE